MCKQARTVRGETTRAGRIIVPNPLTLLRKVASHARLLRHDPERFAANLLQFTNPERFRDRLVDVQTAVPMHVQIDPSLTRQPALNVLQPILSPISMTGGPNTIITLAYQLARDGVPVRIVTTRGATDPVWFRRHLLALTGATEYPASLQVAYAGAAQSPLPIGRSDVFLATHWTTAQQLKAVLPRMASTRFFYLIQDFEPGFHAWSSNYALALETYDLDFIPIINERMLSDYFAGLAIGRFAEPDFAANALVFEPAIDPTLFHPAPPAERAQRQVRRLLFYARPTNPRNMLGVGLHALRAAIAAGAFNGAWAFTAIGDRGSLPDLDLGGGHTLRPARWEDYAGYARQLREADILLCPMLSPHTSYPVLEMAASGGIAVTNVFATKTVERLGQISKNIIAAPATIEGYSAALAVAAAAAQHDCIAPGRPNLPQDWNEALASVTQEMTRLFHLMIQDRIVA
jgi:O-antigen biosynthesis protein